MKKIALFLIAAAATLTVNAQFTEGKITTKITYPDFEDNTGILAMLPKENVTYVKGDKARMEQPGAMGGKTIIITDNKKKETHMYLDLMGSKYDIVTTEKDAKADQAKAGDWTITQTTETKTIAGYSCKKAIAKNKDGEEMEIWYAPDLKREGADWASPYKGIDGMMMEFSMTKDSSMGPMTMKMTVTEVSKETVDDSKFKAPDGEWKKTTMADFAKSMSGGK